MTAQKRTRLLPASSRDRSLEGWRSELAVSVATGIGLAGASGLWIYLAPFSVASQLVVLLHVAIGGLLVLPLVRYAARHLASWWRQKTTATLLLGYCLLLATTVTGVSGIVLAWQGSFGPRLSPAWDLLHLVGGITVVGLITAHVLLAYLRRRPAAARDRELGIAMTGFGRRSLRLAGAPVLAVGLLALLWPRDTGRFDLPADYTLPEYSQSDEDYRGNPFAPTFARTDDGRLVSPRLLADSLSCGSAGCHEQIVDEWEPSAHRFSAMNPPFQEVQRRFALDRGAAETRYCAGCHDPISLFAGAKDPSRQSLSAPGVEEGVSCASCHSISKVDERGNADYELTPPRKYLAEGRMGVPKAISDFLIRTYPRQHLADYDRNLLRTPEFCGACHKQFIPEALNRFGMVEGQNQYDEWKNSHWNADDPSVALSCRDCHMRLVLDSRDPGRGEGGDRWRSPDDAAHRHHGFIATNNFMPRLLDLPHWREQERATNEWIRGETVLPEIAEVWPGGPVAGLEIVAPGAAAPGEEVELRVVVTNRKAGHNFTTGPLDFVRSWVHLRVLDDAGGVLAEFGSIDPSTRRIQDSPGVEHVLGNARDEGTLVLEALPVDESGEFLRRHELWRKAGGKGKRVVFPGYADSHRYRVRMPDSGRGTIRVEARLQYRRYRQEFLDLVLPDLERSTGVYQPTTTQAEVSARIRLKDGTASPRLGG